MLRQVRMGLLEVPMCSLYVSNISYGGIIVSGISHSIILGPGEEDVTHLKQKLLACTKVPVENQVILDLTFSG